jgi:signal transduction histidine kinase
MTQKNEGKTREELLEELATLRQAIARLEKSEAELKRRLHALQLSGRYAGIACGNTDDPACLVEELYEIARRQREELEEEKKARGALLRNLAHELRTPLTPLIAAAELLKDILTSNPGTNEYKLAELLLNGGKALIACLDDFLEMAGLTLGTIRIEPRPVDIKKLVEAAASRSRQVLERKNQRLVLDVPQTLPTVAADAARLERVIISLISIAAQFSPEQGSVTIRAHAQGNEGVIEVEDQGGELSEEEQESLLKPYHRVEQDRQRAPGVGLKLAVSKQTVEAHRGKMWVRSVPGRGNVFGFSVPVQTQHSSLDK